MMDINELIKAKKAMIKTEDDKAKIKVIEDLVKDKACFFKIDINTAFGILRFLGVEEKNIQSYYMHLISPDNYMKNVNKVYQLRDEEDSNGLNL